MQVEQTTTYRRRGALIACFITQDGVAWGLQWTPESGSIGGLGNNYAQVERQGRKPLVRFDSNKVRTMNFTHPVLASGSDAATCTVVVRILMDLADSVQRVRLVNVSADIETRGWWFITGLAVKINQRDEDQQILSADLTWDLIEANDERPKIAVTPPPPPPPPPPAVASPAPSMQGDYTVVKGDSLWRIASRLLGSGPRWTELFDINAARLNLAPPEMYAGLLTVWIYPGQVLHIPAR